MPLMVTGGFRSRVGIEAALGTDGAIGDCDVIGLGRPLCWMPDFPRRLLARQVERIDDLDRRLQIRARGWLSPQGRGVVGKALNAFAAQSWYYCQLFRLADGRPADLGRGALDALGEYVVSELRAARATRRAYPRRRG